MWEEAVADKIGRADPFFSGILPSKIDYFLKKAAENPAASLIRKDRVPIDFPIVVITQIKGAKE